jgi:transcription initiation factor TFIID subunit 3
LRRRRYEQQEQQTHRTTSDKAFSDEQATTAGQSETMTTQSAFFHALMRPAILQTLRSTGYHSAKPSVIDSLTDIAARYLFALCEKTASHAIHNQGEAGDFTIGDVRLALQEMGALQPERPTIEQDWSGEEDTRGVDEFIEWFSGQRMTELMEMGIGDGEGDATDYLGGTCSLATHQGGSSMC